MRVFLAVLRAKRFASVVSRVLGGVHSSRGGRLVYVDYRLGALGKRALERGRGDALAREEESAHAHARARGGRERGCDARGDVRGVVRVETRGAHAREEDASDADEAGGA